MNVAIIGAGRMGRRHISVVRNLGWHIVGVCDSNTAAIDSVKVEYGLDSKTLYANSEALFAERVPECVIIATTADSHCEYTCRAASRGAQFILVEKPMAVSLEQCDRMIDICREKGVHLAVNHQMRFMRQYLDVDELASSVAYGGLSSMTVIAGNFGLAMNGTHYFEAFRFLARENIATVSAWISNETIPNPRGPNFKDIGGCVRATTGGGKRLYLDVSTDHGHGIVTIYACRNGIITVNELTGQVCTTVREEQYRALPTTRYGMASIEKTYHIPPTEVINSTAAVLNALVAGRNSVSGEDGRRAIEVLIAAHLSGERHGRYISVEENLDRARIYPWA